MKHLQIKKLRTKRLLSILCLLVILLTVFMICVSKDYAKVKENRSSISVSTYENKQENSKELQVELPESLSEYIEPFGTILDKWVYDELSKKYSEIVVQYKNGKMTYEALEDKMIKIDKTLRKNGILLPYSGLEDFLNSIPNFSNSDRKFILENESELFYDGMTESKLTEEEAEKLYEQIIEIFKKYGLNFDEIAEQLMNMSYKLAIFDIQGEKAVLSKDKRVNMKPIDEQTKSKYLSVIEQTRNIIPKDIWNNISSFEFNTDGIENVLAHTVSESYQNTTFRLAIDIKDVLDKNGQLTKDGKETIVHETGHLITLFSSQVIVENIDDPYNAEVEQKYQPNSYLMKFYNQFWSNRYEEFLKLIEKTGDTFDFYEKYKNEFVSDYAASNLEEDIAESFRVFVFEDRPTGDSIIDEKIKFFYQFDEIVKWRDEFRSNLSIN